MKFKDTQDQAYINDVKRQIIKDDFLACYKKLENKKSEINSVIKHHKRLINSLELLGKKKYKTLTYLEDYRNTENKITALMLLTCTLNNMSGLSLR